MVRKSSDVKGAEAKGGTRLTIEGGMIRSAKNDDLEVIVSLVPMGPSFFPLSALLIALWAFSASAESTSC